MTEKERAVLTLGAFTNGTDLWLPSKQINALFYKKIDSNDEVEYISSFKSLANDCAWQIEQVICFEEQLFFFSRCAYEVWIMDIKTKKMDAIIYSIPKSVNIRNVIKVENKVWIISGFFDDPIITFDLNKKKFTDVIKWKEDIPYSVSDQSSITKASLFDNIIYFATRERNNIYICKIVCLDKKIEFVKIPHAQFISCLTVNEDGIWALIQTNDDRTRLECYSYDLSVTLDSADMQLTGVWPKDPKYSLMPFIKMLCYKKSLFLIPALFNRIIIYDTFSKEEKALEYPSNSFYTGEDRESLFFECRVLDNLAYIYPSSQKRLLIMDMDKKVLKEEIVNCNDYMFMESCRKSNMILTENSNISLDCFMECVTLKNSFPVNKDVCGSKIYSYLKGKN